jgi:hypothetical protein
MLHEWWLATTAFTGAEYEKHGPHATGLARILGSSTSMTRYCGHLFSGLSSHRYFIFKSLLLFQRPFTGLAVCHAYLHLPLLLSTWKVKMVETVARAKMTCVHKEPHLNG